ncbi:MAG TPA: helix-turn-helix transcriptional regulator [Streptosporangiaceae bacterium]|nr:helix-turn-helix transcriptional regulator [Streptosporangiaceae bacterium]
MADGERITAAWRALGRQLHADRQARGLSQEQLSELIHYSRSSIANVETGRQKVARRFWERCDKALGTGEKLALRWDDIHAAAQRELELAAAGADQASMTMARPARPPDVPPALLEGARQEPIVIALAAEAIDLATWAEHSNVGDMTIDAMADAAGRLAREYLRKPPLPVLRDTAALYRRVAGLLRGGHQSLRQARDLYVIAGQLLAFLSWVSSDVGQPAAAEAHARAGWVMAGQADHDPLRALVLIAQGKNAYWEGRFGDAAGYATRGLDYAPPTSARVLLACQLGDARQAVGDIAGALEAQTAAKRARDEITSADEVGGVWACGRARQANYAMGVHLRAGDPAAALAEAETARQAYQHGEPWAYGTWGQIRIGSGIAHLLAGRVDGTASELAPILRMPPEQRLATLTTRLGEVDMRLRHRRFEGSTEVRTLRQQIAGYRAQAITTRALPPGQS